MAGRRYEANEAGRLLRVLMDLRNRAEAENDNEGAHNLSGIGAQALAALLSGRFSNNWEEEDDDDDYYPSDEDDRHSEDELVTEPQPEGVKLLRSGEYGPIRSYQGVENTKVTPKTLFKPSIRPIYSSPTRDLTANLVPNTNGTTVATYGANMYTAQFSDDSSFYYTCSQDFNLHIFDMTKPPQKFGHIGSRGNSLKSTMPLRKEIRGQEGRWTITDANLSPDNSRIIYSSIHPTVYMTSTSPEGSSTQIPINFSDNRHTAYYSRFGIWSCRFSADGNEVVAGGDGKIFVYDLLADRRTVKIDAHDDDVNSCCWADTGSGNILVSASDDSYLKVWDRRSLSSKKPSGVLMGHTEGITYVSAKGDGRYVISNGKDQTLRLWDLRQMRSNKDMDTVGGAHFGLHGFDYRYSHYPRSRRGRHPMDCSVMTYTGHSVLRTLIRCHFSPAETTGQQYIYSGSSDGRVHIWSLDGRVVQILDRSKTLPPSFSPSEPEPRELPRHGPRLTCVRDVSWHSQEPVLMSAAWDHRVEGTAIARHEWKGLSKLRGRLDTWVEKQQAEAQEHERRGLPLARAAVQRMSRQMMPGGLYDNSDDDEEGSEYDEDNDE
ncbi:WD-repeat-containing protein [Coprinopsis cinerea okayama7|uniref:WD-repeat-containing protein n=1 Tax=Coprinopsis cinerea (strain Okayama-7 / 130 / ATCC MYA-4618 / FGSC 9003) TaxID=240176 RepID=A8N380_COPC7|nr:WD-repeat-containing protein [Coprinopsis cinerea okayama7\|eukprot:XP_001829325.2 WD-repeat-containing protein [Coprinopsis cinerea okayama7\